MSFSFVAYLQVHMEFENLHLNVTMTSSENECYVVVCTRLTGKMPGEQQLLALSTMSQLKSQRSNFSFIEVFDEL